MNERIDSFWLFEWIKSINRWLVNQIRSFWINKYRKADGYRRIEPVLELAYIWNWNRNWIIKRSQLSTTLKRLIAPKWNWWDPLQYSSNFNEIYWKLSINTREMLKYLLIFHQICIFSFQFWPILTNFDQFWPNFYIFDQICIFSFQFWPILTNFDQFWPILTNI